MLKVQRLEQIQEELQKHGVLSIEALAEALHVSQSTIRRDLFELEEQGEVLKRICGGAVRKALNTSHEPSFDVRQDMFLEEKQRIALAAKALVNENETLFLDSGTTVCELAKVLDSFHQLYIATNDLKSAMVLTQFPSIDLMVLGGSLRRDHYSLNGYFTETMIGQIHADKVFLGVDAIDPNIGFMNFSAVEVKSKKMMMEASYEKIVLCDHSKFERIAFVNICRFEDIDLIITGKEASPDTLHTFEDRGVTIMTV